MNFDRKSDDLSKYVFFFLLSIFILSIGFFVGSKMFPEKSSSSSSTSNLTDFSKLNAVVNIIRTKYYYQDRLASSKIEDSTIKGYLSSLEDFPTRYLGTQDYSQYKDTLAGNIFGIGIEIGVSGDGSKITSVYPDTPAFKAGLQKNDILAKIDSTDATKVAPSEAATLIRGAIGTKVNIEVLRDGKSLSFEITRDKITTKSITFENLNSNSICKITISRFTDDSVDTWKNNWNDIVNKFSSNKCGKLILDLRGNGGGYVEASKFAIEDFVSNGTQIYGQKKVDGSIDKIYADRKNQNASTTNSAYIIDPRLKDIPVVILINANTASASEIFSGSLQTLGRAKLVGTNSYGKGSEQDTTIFNDNSALIYTIANWTLPNDQVIDQNFPIKPDYSVALTEDDIKNDRDPQLDQALQLLK